MEKRYLFTPGPTPVPPEVLAATAEPIVHHRGLDFAIELNQVLLLFLARDLAHLGVHFLGLFLESDQFLGRGVPLIGVGGLIELNLLLANDVVANAGSERLHCIG